MRGSITKRGRASWRIKFDVNSSGERCTKYFTVHGTKRDAEAALTKLLGEADKGTLIDASKISVADHLASWLKGKELSDATRESYQTIIRSLVIPGLGGIVQPRADQSRSQAQIAQNQSR
jgi:hypothetical protein